MALEAGSKLGPYEIVDLLGKGGMGEVYRARDPRLNRDVAVKVSHQQFSERFEREAKVVASLNHPNICHLYDVGPNYLVMELVEGEAPHGPMPLDAAMKLARQIVDALDAAHEKGVTHRDLKPANIKVRPDGTVKVLDFGLAKVVDQNRERSGSEAPTLTIGATQPGTMLGTPAYMAPEQVRAKDIDKRADIWAFGVVFYELLTGERLFQGDDLTDVLASVVKEQPDFNKAPVEVQRLLRRCLEKDRTKRLRDIGDVWELLEGQVENRLQVENLPHNKPSKIPWVAAGVAAAAAVGLGVLYFQPAPPVRVVKTTAMLPEGVTLAPGTPPAVSPDGRRVAFAATKSGVRSLWVRDLDALEARMLPGTDTATRPFWAPDSRWVAFFVSGKLKKIDVTGGPALGIADVTGSGGGTWGSKEVIAVTAAQGIGMARVPAAGGTLTKVLDAPLSRAPWFLPDGRHFLYTGTTKEDAEAAIYIGDIEATEEQNAKSRKMILHTESNAAYAEPGYLMFVRERTLMAQPFDASKLATTGDAVPVAEQVDFTTPPTGAQFSVSRNGVLVYSSGGASANSQLTWFDRSGKSLGTVGPPGDIQWAAISPDGSTVAFDRRNGSEFDIWLHDLVRGAESRFTFGPKGNSFPAWSGDGTHIAFSSSRTSAGDIYQRALGGTAMDEPLDTDELTKRPTDWSRDGKYILEESNAAGQTRNDVWMLPTSDKKPVRVLNSEFVEGEGRLSPDGHWLAYRSNESGRNEIYVVSFPTPTAKSKVSTSGGTWPVWSRDGRELFYKGGDDKLRAVKVRIVGDKFDAGLPEELFGIRLPSNGRYDVSKDGRFLVPMQVEQAAVVPLTIVQNWQAGLK